MRSLGDGETRQATFQLADAETGKADWRKRLLKT